MAKGIFTISLDFELHWGGFEKWDLQQYSQYFLNTREVIPKMLTAFEEYGIHTTWATVGLLFHSSKEELLSNIPQLRPAYAIDQLSAYHFIEHQGIGSNETEDPFHFALSLIKKIMETPHQEIGTHTFSHYYCNEAGQNVDQFREDLKAARRIAEKYGKKITSLVFPRNQFNDHYLKACFKEGITAVRSNPLDWFWHIESTQSESLWKRLNRGLDAYFPIGKRNTYKPDTILYRPGFPLCIPASRLLRPYNPKELFLNRLKIDRIKSEMTRAAKAGEIYHLWWHPHNFGNFPEQSMHGLLEILTHFQTCRKNWNMEPLTMSEIASRVLSKKQDTIPHPMI